MSKVKAITRAIQRLYPRELADSSWDNTGLLLDLSNHLTPSQVNEDVAVPPRLLLTIDLTQSVADEAVEHRADVVVAYHPFIFRGLKSIGPENPQQNSLLKLVQAGISVYCPHTAVDAQRGGVNDWLGDIVSDNTKNEKSRSVLQPTNAAAETGMGRLIELKSPVPVEGLIKSIKHGLGLSTVQLVRSKKLKNEPISSIAVCAGSGQSVLAGSNADLWLTGELGHHEMLYLLESGTTAIVCGHSNTERGFLQILAKQLQNELPGAEIKLATTDCDPIQYI